jgi:CHAT domain-containing protein
MAGGLRAAGPLIFFNACHSGRLGFSLTRLGSWGAGLVQLGCGGFLGTLWPVTDQAALAFARAFYAALLDGHTVGEAVAAARKQVRADHPADPTWLAYRCFGDPHARIEIGDPDATPHTTGTSVAR